MTPEEKNKVENLKKTYRKELEQEQDREQKRKYNLHLEHVAKVEILWENEGATEEDLPQLREWVDKRFSGNYYTYFTAYDNPKELLEQEHIRNSYPSIQKQMQMTYDYWRENWYELAGYVVVKNDEGGKVWQKAEQVEAKARLKQDKEEKTWWQRVKEEFKLFIEEL